MDSSKGSLAQIIIQNITNKAYVKPSEDFWFEFYGFELGNYYKIGQSNVKLMTFQPGQFKNFTILRLNSTSV